MGFRIRGLLIFPTSPMLRVWLLLTLVLVLVLTFVLAGGELQLQEGKEADEDPHPGGNDPPLTLTGKAWQGKGRVHSNGESSSERRSLVARQLSCCARLHCCHRTDLTGLHLVFLASSRLGCGARLQATPAHNIRQHY